MGTEDIIVDEVMDTGIDQATDMLDSVAEAADDVSGIPVKEIATIGGVILAAGAGIVYKLKHRKDKYVEVPSYRLVHEGINNGNSGKK